jgi:hypothetical protein
MVSIISVIVLIIVCIILKISRNEGAVIVMVLFYLPFGLYLSYCQRCRHCGRWPTKGHLFDEYCPGCGELLDD